MLTWQEVALVAPIESSTEELPGVKKFQQAPPSSSIKEFVK